VLIRTWNLFHGNTLPPTRRAYLREMVELATADRPDVVCLQEVPAWALGLVGDWAGMQAVTARTMLPRIGPVEIPSRLGRALTSVNHGLFRSAFAGQGNAILLQGGTAIDAVQAVTLNSPALCRAEAPRLGLSDAQIRRWEAERRVCQIVRADLGAGPVRIANLHASSIAGDPRFADCELRLAVSLVEQAATPGELVVVAGDLNVRPEESSALAELAATGLWQDVGPGIDHVLLRGDVAVAGRVWPDEERRCGAGLLSDHAPVEAEIQAA
jgi:endonuclease/exonuclease/phosphatase family metal-dependent hydrolase